MFADDLKALLTDFNSALNRLEAEMASICEREKALVPETFREHYQRDLVFGERHDYSENRKKAARHVFAVLVRRAETQFAPLGATLKIDSGEIEEHFELRDNDFANFDPVAVWTHLEEQYGKNGPEIAYTQAADPIVSLFDISTDSPIKTVSGQLVLEKRVWIDSSTKKYSDRNELSYGCANDIYALCKALATFAAWADFSILAHDLMSDRSRGRLTGTIESRARYPFGDPKGPSVVVITYTTRYEFRFSPDVGSKLQEFLGLYATRFLKAA